MRPQARSSHFADSGSQRGAGWSAGTTLLLYWCESLLLAALIALRIVLHRRATRAKGTLLHPFLSVGVPFNLFHGAFLLPILFLLLPRMTGGAAVGVDLADLRTGVIGMTAFFVAGFLVNLFAIARRPFIWIEQLVMRSLRRVVIVHLSIIFGMVAIAFWEVPRAFLIVFVILKTTSDLSWLLPQGELSSQPPRQAFWIDRLGKFIGGASLADDRRQTHSAEERIRLENEEVLKLESDSVR